MFGKKTKPALHSEASSKKRTETTRAGEKKRSTAAPLVIGLAAILAVGAGAIYLPQLVDQKILVPVAAQPIKAGTPIIPQAVTWQEIPASAVANPALIPPREAIDGCDDTTLTTEAATATCQEALSAIDQGQIIYTTNYTGFAQATTNPGEILSYLLVPQPDRNVAGAVQEGQLLTVYITMDLAAVPGGAGLQALVDTQTQVDPETGRTYTNVTIPLYNQRVASILPDPAGGRVDELFGFSMQPAQALFLASALDNGGQLRFGLQSEELDDPFGALISEYLNKPRVGASEAMGESTFAPGPVDVVEQPAPVDGTNPAAPDVTDAPVTDTP